MGLFDFLEECFSNTYTDNRGYLRYSDNNKLVHRVVAARKIGRNLNKGEVVHHIDRNKKNNNPNNLWVFPNQSAHDKVHKLDAQRHGNNASYKGFAKKKEWSFWELFR